MATDDQQGASLAALAAKIAAGKNIVLVDDRGAYGQGLMDQVEKDLRARGITRVSRDYTTDSAVAFQGILTKAKGGRAAVIVYGGADAQAGPDGQTDEGAGRAGDVYWRRRRVHRRVDGHYRPGSNEGQYCTQAGEPRSKIAWLRRFRAAFRAALR